MHPPYSHFIDTTRVSYNTRSVIFISSVAPTRLVDQGCGILIAFHSYAQRNIFEISLNQTEIRWIYHFPIDFEHQTDVCLVPNQSVHGKYNLISV